MPAAASSVTILSAEPIMLEMVQDRIATSVTGSGFERLLYCDVKSKWNNYKFISFLG
jgi:hypothetical protein